MNRKQRRAAQKQPQFTGARHAAAAVDTAALLERAIEHDNRGELGAAAHLYKKLLALDPRNAAACNNLGLVYLAQEKPAKASAQFAQVAGLAPQTLDQFGEVVETLKLLKPALADALKTASDAWPKILPPEELLGADGITALADDPYLQTVLASTVVRDVAFERLLTSLRAAILRDVLDNKSSADEDLFNFCAALAQQCFINEYVFAVTPEELDLVERLKTSAESGDFADPLPLLALAMYVPLYSLNGAQALSEHPWPTPVAAVVRQQISEPREEKKLNEALARLTPISGDVTSAVRQQYEENPYPRWVGLTAMARPVALTDHIRQQFPAASFRPVGDGDNLDILVAGCGTGRHALELAQSYHGARVLAIDLSLASLACAKRKTPPALAGKIEFAQADILALGSIGRTFDFINAGGVFHHMADPLAGWRALIALMRPDGVMQVGLYSELARKEIVAAREMIAERGYRPTAEDIRRCRQDLLQDSVTSEVFSRMNDFYGISACRDLLFHVHEQRLSIPAIKAFLAEHDLKFIGFEFSPQEAHLHYRSAFAAAGWSLADLDRWHAYERENPKTFAGMYNFWTQKN
jgi:SAM-dependent methyltransferase/tetratricopeptide (TPR) repeat protein